MPSIYQEHHIPDSTVALSTFERPDYVDVFTATIPDASERSPERWARRVLEETPLGRSAPLLWRGLGLRLGPRPSPDYVQGWKVAARGEDWIRIETASWFASAEAVVRAAESLLSIALFVRYDRPIARVIWVPVSVLHRRAMPVLLGQALKVTGT